MHRRALLCSLVLAAMPLAARAAPAPVTVFAAASLTDVLGDVDRLWQQTGQAPLQMSFASSSTLARQIEQGAPAQVFASADEQWADYLDKRGLLVPGTRRDLLDNSLVLVEPKANLHPVDIKPGVTLDSMIGSSGRLAVGDPAHVPAGIYAQQALTKLGLWQAAQPRLAPADSVRSALLLVERGEAPAGIVYSTDVAVSPTLGIAGTFPAETHDPITYPFALVKGGDTAESRAFLSFLSGPQAKAAFERRGFIVR